jgi:hypothetical protein
MWEKKKKKKNKKMKKKKINGKYNVAPGKTHLVIKICKKSKRSRMRNV